MTGVIKFTPLPLPFSYPDCPMLYLVLEVVEAFLDLMDHCCVCGAKLGLAGLKPALCEKPLCQFGLASMGVGCAVVAEVKKDPMVADFLVCLAVAAYGTRFFIPPLPPDLGRHAATFFERLPPMSSLAASQSDKDLAAGISRPAYEILRFILMSNRAHLICLPGELAIQECRQPTHQFLSVVATPERELVFQRKKAESKCPSAWLWHGSLPSRWHSILHSGLRDLGNTDDATHSGHWFGEGVYQSNSSSTSMYYTRHLEGAAEGRKGKEDRTEVSGQYRQYKNNRLTPVGSHGILALIENVQGPALKNAHPNEYTQKDNNGLVVRCLMLVNSVFEWDVCRTPPKHIPSLAECLKFSGKRRQ
jgi:poly [ADP-ribose] polymerase 6/8